MNNEEHDDLEIDAHIVNSLLPCDDESITQEQIDAFDNAASQLDESDRELLKNMDPLARIKSLKTDGSKVVELPNRVEGDETWIQAAARQKDGKSYDYETQREIEKRRKEILDRRNEERDTGERG